MQQPWSELDDGTLIRAYRDQAAEAAFSELVHRYEGRLFRVLVGMVSDPALAEELCQRALVKAALSLDQLTKGQAFYSWLLRVARSAALDELKKHANANHDVYEEVMRDSAADSPNHGIKDAIRSVLKRLTDEDRMALLLSDLEQLTIEEISMVLGTNRSATKMRISRARSRFRDLYEELTDIHGPEEEES